MREEDNQKKKKEKERKNNSLESSQSRHLYHSYFSIVLRRLQTSMDDIQGFCSSATSPHQF